MKKLVVKLVRVYQNSISPIIHIVFRGGCRFVPTCSQYLIEAVEIHGVLKGVFLGFVRLLKCNPLFKGGYDPVPKKKK